jgi:hypothetical protein
MLLQNAPASYIVSPPRRRVMSSSVWGAPSKRACNRPANQQVATGEREVALHSRTQSMARGSSTSCVSVRVAAGAGSTFTETSSSTPRMPSEPAISRDTSYPATFFMTSPPNLSTRPSPVSTRQPST